MSSWSLGHASKLINCRFTGLFLVAASEKAQRPAREAEENGYRTQYLVKWGGYLDDQSAWINEDNIHEDLMEAYHSATTTAWSCFHWRRDVFGGVSRGYTLNYPDLVSLVCWNRTVLFLDLIFLFDIKFFRYLKWMIIHLCTLIISPKSGLG